MNNTHQHLLLTCVNRKLKSNHLALFLSTRHRGLPFSLTSRINTLVSKVDLDYSDEELYQLLLLVMWGYNVKFPPALTDIIIAQSNINTITPSMTYVIAGKLTSLSGLLSLHLEEIDLQTFYNRVSHHLSKTT
jgi:hypothetical protein